MKNILKLKTIVLSLLLMVSCTTEEPRSASSTSAKPKPVVLTTA